MIDAVERVQGRIPYAIDLDLPGMLHAKLVRSVAPHARIRSIDTAAAAQVEGVRMVVTAADVARLAGVDPVFGPVFRDQPLLATDTVRFVGDPIVAVVADNLDAASAAADLVRVDLEELPAVFDPVEALEASAPVLHAGEPKKSAMFRDIIVNNVVGTNVCNQFHIRKGDVEAGFAEAEVVFEDEFRSPPVQHVPLETHICIAVWEGDRVVCYANTQTPFVLRAQLAEVFGLSQAQVRVIVSNLGGAYGAKCYPKIEPLTVVLARLARRPVRLHLTREEEFITVTKHQMVMRMKTGLKRDGTIVAREATGWFNTGAYADIGPRLIMYGALGVSGPYRIPNLNADTYAVYTNIVPAGAFRGYGISQAGWAHESHLDMIAERMGIDPLELRLRNVLHEGDTFSTGDAVTNVHLEQMLRECADAIGWETDRGPTRIGSKVRAKGLSLICWRALPMALSTATAKLNDDGTLHLLMSSVEMGQGVRTAMAILAGERLGIPTERISVSFVDTDVTPYDQQTSASRSTYSMGHCVIGAVDQIRDQLLDLAAEQFEAARSDLQLDGGQVRVSGVPTRSLSFGDIVKRSRRANLFGEGRYQGKGALDAETGQALDEGPGHWHQAAGAAEVEVDTDTGRVRVLRYRGATFAGRVVNPVQAELQTEGGIIFGLGQALFEEMRYDGGQLQGTNLGDSMIPSIEDLPETLEVAILEKREAGEIHGLGENSLPPVMPAVANAVFRATGVRITELPVTPEKVLRGLRELESARAG
jgi:CO/xanthine dehydrogenase Mo-binding subunit